MPQQYRYLAHSYLLANLVLPIYASALEPLVWQKTTQVYAQQTEQNLLCSSDTLLSVLIADVCQQLITDIDQAHKKDILPDFLSHLSLEQARDIVDIYYWKTEQFEQLLNRNDPRIHQIIGRFIHQYPPLQTYKDDVYQEAILLLWEQLSHNKLARFEGTSLFGTFFYTVIRWTVIRAIKRIKPIEQKVVDIWANSEDDVIKTPIIDLADHQANEDHAPLLPQHLQTIQYFTLSLKSTDSHKLLFCWQLVYSVYFANPSDVQRYYPNCSSDLFLDILLIQQQKNTKEQIFEHLSLLIEQLTYSQINKDALKKWLNRKRQMVYSLLFTAYLIENKSTEINAYWELLIQRFFAAKLVY